MSHPVSNSEADAALCVLCGLQAETHPWRSCQYFQSVSGYVELLAEDDDGNPVSGAMIPRGHGAECRYIEGERMTPDDDRYLRGGTWVGNTWKHKRAVGECKVIGTYEEAVYLDQLRAEYRQTRDPEIVAEVVEDHGVTEAQWKASL